MKLKWRSNDSVSVLALCGRLDAYGAPAVIEWLDDAGANRGPRVIVDLANVTFIDSTGLATLVRGLRRCRQQSGDLVLCGLQEPVQVIFRMTRLDKAFEIFPTEESALSAVHA